MRGSGQRQITLWSFTSPEHGVVGSFIQVAKKPKSGTRLSSESGRRVIGLFAPTVPAVRWRPWRVPHVLLGLQDISCAGCRARRCPVEGHPCLGAVSVGQAVAAAVHLSDGRGAGAPNASPLSPFTPIPPKDGGGALRVLREHPVPGPVAPRSPPGPPGRPA